MWRVATSSLCVIEVIYNLPSSLPTNSNFSPRVLLDVFHVDSWKSSKQSLISVFVFTVFISGGWEVFFFTVPQSELSRVTFGLQEATLYQIHFQSFVYWICRVKIFFTWNSIMCWCPFLLQDSCFLETSHILGTIMSEACSNKQCDWHLYW